MLHLFKFLWAIFQDEQGLVDVNNVVKTGEEEKHKEEEKPEDKPEEEKPENKEEKPEDKPEEEKVENKYEGFFDKEPTPDEIFAKLKETTDALNSITGKTTVTEKNLNAIKKSLKEVGLNAYTDEEGNVKFSVDNKPEVKPKGKERTVRFNEDHRKKFQDFFDGEGGGEGFLELLDLYVRDIFDGEIETRTAKAEEDAKANQAYMKARVASSQKLVKLYPSLRKPTDDNPNPDFNQKFWNRATEIYEKDYVVDGFETNPNGQLWAAMEAAAEMSVSPTSIVEAKKEGIKIGKENKKVLGPTGGKKALGTPGKKSREEYLAMDEESRAAYDKEQAGIE